jgi:alpha-L-rhamnosidase
MDVNGFFAKWLGDVAADQKANGAVPFVIPDVLSRGQKEGTGSSGWGDVAVIVPWTMYLTYGDARLLERQYPSMRAWVEYERASAGPDLLWNSGFHFGDWLAFATTRSDYPGATTGKDLIATAFYAYSTDLLGRIARILGKPDEAARYSEQLAKIKSAFRREFVTDSGRVGENTQTAYALALQFDLLPDDLRPVAARRLAQDVREWKHLTTGFVGASYVCPVLSRYGYLDEAYMLLNREEYPSWLYPVTRGATTMWERWDGIKPDSTFQDVGMNSFNHYAYGAVGDWMYRVVAGLNIDPAAPGYKHIVIRPQPGGGFTSAQATLTTLYGPVSAAWRVDGRRLLVNVRVPPNARATVRLPAARLEQVTEGGRPVAAAPGVTRAAQDADAVVVEVGSGDYAFAYDAAALTERLRGGGGDRSSDRAARPRR